ncbi:MAG: hypothetical protein K2W92_04500 [Alphaproteobacteria bacterium]|nr:hypothetical protein [Alphaproteobacteria bacterium]
MKMFHTFLRLTNNIFFLFVCLLISDSKAVKITEGREEIFIESEDKYPKKIFAVEDFLQEVEENLSTIKTKPIVAIDLSNDESLNSRDIKKILTYFKKMNIKVKALNVSGTGINSEVLPFFDQLLKEPSFKRLDISDTTVAEITMDTDNPKIIFVPAKLMKIRDTKLKIKNLFGEATFNRHLRYYSVDTAFFREEEED